MAQVACGDVFLTYLGQENGWPAACCAAVTDSIRAVPCQCRSGGGIGLAQDSLYGFRYSFSVRHHFRKFLFFPDLSVCRGVSQTGAASLSEPERVASIFSSSARKYSLPCAWPKIDARRRRSRLRDCSVAMPRKTGFSVLVADQFGVFGDPFSAVAERHAEAGVRFDGAVPVFDGVDGIRPYSRAAGCLTASGIRQRRSSSKKRKAGSSTAFRRWYIAFSISGCSRAALEAFFRWWCRQIQALAV